MKALVTGGAGFIGSHLVDALINQQAAVHVIDNLSTGHRSYVHSKAIFHNVDIRSQEAFDIIIKEQPDIVFHLAAQADVTISIASPLLDADINVVGTLNILRACKEANVKQIIFSSTSAVYGNLAKDRINERDSTNPISFYGASKLAAEEYIRLYHELFKLPYTILRYGNVYGPRQTPKGEGGVISVFLDKIKNNEILHVHGDGEQTRDFVFVEDVVSANLASVKNAINDTVHISTGKKTSVNQILHLLKNTHSSPLQIEYVASRQGDIKHSCLDSTKAANLLNWSAATNIGSALEKTYRSKLNASSAKEVN